MSWFKSEFAKQTGPTGKLNGNGSKLLSAAYKAQLGNLVDEATREEHHLPEGTTWADFVALQTVKRAVGMVAKENICFTAITELREATEGKIAEKIVATNNEELMALARAINGEPAEQLPDSTDPDSTDPVDPDQPSSTE